MKITIVAFEGCMTSAVFGQADAFSLAAYIADSRADSSWSSHDIRIATPNGAPVQGFGGHRIDPHCSLRDARDSNVVLLPPILNDIEQTLMQESGLVSWLASFPARSTLLASTCTGAFLLAEAGVLDGRRITTNPAFSALFQQRYPGVRLALDERIIDDNMVICAGATTAYLNLAIHVIDRLAGHDLAVSTAKALSIDRNPESQRPYFQFIAPKDHGDDKVLQLQNWIEVHHHKPIGMEEMTSAAAMSIRNLNRRFVSATGLSPQQYLRRVRIETAKRLLEGQTAPVDRIAGQVGYGDTRAFIRAFGAVAGLSPGEYRRRFRAHADVTSR
ncbi:helix-turn-helix domain-containing protein [Bradyrhizobium sp. JYMT SZCCT0180]|uniref:GlxA family transcriptional regulator n=1 Tax=Bradyrhizobium sp. JYMT SZCCT0180 TaxID=2807666 RepID=UPI001BAD82E5|nr:helix-turn-helix domain-containing protein [Bradyrhizobium sp. JYMT SZCCT0180]MBR1214801.1 helix-turn-helix domain-containing protein [Bradyrhizobium sp. JYMT SZCCT0180]